MFVVYMYTGHVIWDDALTTSSHGYSWREGCYIRLCGHVLTTSVCEPKYIMAGLLV